MIYLCCDTNIWINISNGFEPPRLLNKLFEEIQNGNITLLLPEIIVTEWNRNKEKFIIEQTQKTTKNQISSLKKLNEFLERNENDLLFLWDKLTRKELHGIDKVNVKIEDLINVLKEHKTEITDRARKNIETVENIFAHNNTITLPTDALSSLTVIKFATEKKFPFENEKNNFADCLIFYQFINYLKDNNIEKAHFVSSNKNDFFPKGELHELLQNEINSTNSFFYKSLSEALNTSLEEELVNQDELRRIEELSKKTLYTCVSCNNRTYNKEENYCHVCNFDGSLAGEFIDCTRCGESNSVIFDHLNIADNNNMMNGFCLNCSENCIVYKCPVCEIAYNFERGIESCSNERGCKNI